MNWLKMLWYKLYPPRDWYQEGYDWAFGLLTICGWSAVPDVLTELDVRSVLSDQETSEFCRGMRQALEVWETSAS